MATNAPLDPSTKAPNTSSVGAPVSPDEVEQLKRFRNKFFPDSRLEAEDMFAKWLFGLTTTIAALGTGFSNTAFAKLSSGGVLAYSLAVLAAGMGLTFAVFALSVELPEADWQSLDTVITGFRKPLRHKRMWLICATIGLGMSLALAAIAVFTTAIQRRPSEKPSGISARLSERNLEPAISLSGLRPGAPAELQIFEEVPGNTVLVGVFRQIADDSGQISYKAPAFKIPREAQGLKLVLNYVRGDLPVFEEREFVFPAETTTTKESSAGQIHAGGDHVSTTR